MLMALLPLSGWAVATNLSTLNFKIAYDSYEYDGHAIDYVNLPDHPNRLDARVWVTNVENPIDPSNYELWYNVVGSEEQTKVAPIAVGDYQVRARAKEGNEYYTGETSAATFRITKATIPSAANYAPTAKTPTYNKEAQDLVTAHTPALDAAYGTVKYSLSADGPFDIAIPTGTNAGTYNVYWKIVGAGNYADYVPAAAVEVTIAKKALDVENLTVSGLDDVNYNGADNKATVSVKWTDPTDETNVINFSNPQVSYYTAQSRAAGVLTTVVKNAKTYYLVIKEPTTSNYSFTIGTSEAAAPSYTISPIPADIVVVGYEKEYNGVAIQVDDANADGYVAPQFSISGLVAADQGKVNINTIAVTASPVFAAKAQNYTVTPNITAATIKDGDDDIDLSTNYTFTKLSNTWTIKKKKLTISAPSNVTRALNAPLNATDVDVKVITSKGALAGEKDAVEAAYKVNLGAGAVTTAYTPVPIEDAFIPGRKVAADYTELAEEARAAAVTAANNLLANYCGEEQDDEIIIVNGTLTVTGAPFTIRPVVATTVNYGTKPVVSWVAYDNTEYHNVLGEESINKDQVAYQFKGGEYTEYTAWTETVYPKKTGTYTVQVVENELIGKGNFTLGEAARNETQFTIVPKPITITLLTATLHIGDTEDNLKDHYTYDDSYEEDLVVGETIAWEPAFARDNEGNLTVEGLVIEDGTNKISTTGAFTGIDAVTGKLLTTGQYNDNYAVTFDAANLTIANDSLEIDGTDITLAITEAAAAGNPYNVTIKERKLTADQWNTLVLPFDVKPLDFCNVIDDYAVFNTLTSAVNGNVKFSLARTTIPAHTPFLVKPTKDILLGKTHTEGSGATAITAHDYVFKGVEIEPFKTTDVDGIPAAIVNDAQYIGTYTGVSLSEGDGIYVPVSGKFYPLADVLSQYHIASVPLPYTAAYLNVTSGTDARIFVEEADGTITAISNITADGVAMKAEGWYTVNGIRLQGAPTEKGVYINNGKKVVIK